ncbi:MAG: FG-GAP repeat domain-containing protein [Thermoplasmatota archaeon]
MCGGITIRERKRVISFIVILILVSTGLGLVPALKATGSGPGGGPLQTSGETLPCTRNSVQFPSPIKLALDEMWDGIIISDLDENGFPEVIVSNWDTMYENISYERGLHSFQFDEEGSVERRTHDLPEKLRNLTPNRLIDIDEDNDLDLMVFGQTIMEVEDGNITGNTFPTNFQGPVLDAVASDIDCDGDFDIAGNSDISNIYLSRMEDNGSFNGTGWDSGIPRKPPSANSPRYIARNHVMEDINCDGWSDLCTAMGNGNSWWNSGPCQYWNWVSNGDGTWSNFSRGFPTYQCGLNLELADIDNDQDLDYALITDQGRYLYENINGTSWRTRNFPTSLNFDDMLFNDIDEDGFQDLIYYINKDIYDQHNVLIDCSSTLWIAYGDGNFSWNNVKQFESTGGNAMYPHIADLDRDGDKDIVLLKTFKRNYWTYWGNILFCENTMNDSKNITFIDSPSSPHLRSGSIHALSWTMKNASENIDQTFNISISYTGISGKYLPLKTDFRGWRTNIIIPDVPSEDVFLKVERGPFSNTAGPYSIHNSEDRTKLAKLVSPANGGSVVSGGRMELVIDTSSSFPEGSAELRIIHRNGTIDAGTHYLRPGRLNSVIFDHAAETFELDCSVDTGFTWNGEYIHQVLDEEFDIVPPGEIPHHLDMDEVHVPCNVTSNMDVNAFTSSGKNITSDSTYQVIFDRKEMNVESKGGGSFSVKVFEMGTFDLTVRTVRFGQSADHNISVHSHLPVSSISAWFYIEKGKGNVGDWISVMVTGRDYFGDEIHLRDSDLNWTVEGQVMIQWIGDNLGILPTAPGPITVECDIDLGLGLLEAKETIIVGNAISSVSIKVEGSGMMAGTGQVCWIDVVSNSSRKLEDCDVEWSLSGGGLLNTTSGRSVTLNATAIGHIDLYANVTYLNETARAYIRIEVTPGLKDISLDREIRFEVGTEFVVNFTVCGTDGREFTGPVVVNVRSLNTSIATIMKEGNGLTVQGIKGGSTHLEIVAASGGTNISKKFYLIVEGIPRSIIIDIPPVVQLKQDFQVRIRAYDNVGNHPYGSTVTIKTDLYLVSADLYYTFNAVYPGRNSLKITYQTNWHSLSETVWTYAVPNADHIRPGGQEIVLRVGQTERIEPVLETYLDGPIVNEVWNVTSSPGLEYGSFPGHFLLWSNITGEYWFNINLDYYGEYIESNFTIIVIDPPRIASYRILEPGNGIIEVMVLDQFENDITGECNITWVGDFEPIDPYRVRPGKGTIEIHMTFNGSTIIGYYEPPADVTGDRDDGSNLLIWIAAVVILVLLVGSGVSVFLFLRQRRTEGSGAINERIENDNDRSEQHNENINPGIRDDR